MKINIVNKTEPKKISTLKPLQIFQWEKQAFVRTNTGYMSLQHGYHYIISAHILDYDKLLGTLSVDGD